MEEFSDMTAEDDDIKGQTSPSVEPTTAEPERKELDERVTVKAEEDPESPLKSHPPEVTEAIPHPENTDTSTAANADSLKDSEEAEGDTPDSSAEKTTQTTNAACDESGGAEPTSHTCVTPSEPKSPPPVQLPATPASAELLQQDSSGAETPEKSPEKVEAGVTGGAKRRLDVGDSSSAGPEKSPRLMTPCPYLQPFRALCKPHAETAQPTPEQKVPPLKVIIVC